MVMKLLTSHSSVRKYQDITITKKEIRELIRAGQHAASSHFVQSYSVIHVTDIEKRIQLAQLSRNKPQILGAGAVLVFCMDYHRLKKAAHLLGEEIDFSAVENVLVGAVDVGLFAQNIVIAAESKGYGICYIGGVRNAPDEISDLFSLPQGVAPLFAMTIGVPDEKNEVKPRLPLDAIIHENNYETQKYNILIPTYDKIMNQYYMNRESNQKDESWSKSMALFLKNPRRTHMKDFLRNRGFELK